jgi:hypothetical protein
VTWVLYAQRRLKREQKQIGGNRFYAFGTLARARQGFGDGVSRVELEIDNQLGTYWGWLPLRGEVPIYVTDSKENLEMLYSEGDLTRKIQDASSAGLGKIVRLSAKELAEVSG